MVFCKFPNAIVGPEDDIVMPPEAATELDYEVELVLVIGKYFLEGVCGVCMYDYHIAVAFDHWLRLKVCVCVHVCEVFAHETLHFYNRPIACLPISSMWQTL